MAAVLIDTPGPSRALHLVDLENLLADPWARGPAVGRALDEYLERACWQPGDLVFVAGNPWLMVELTWSHGRACHRFAARGPQGADTALLQASPMHWVARRFDRLVVGSGDGVFADRLAAARARGLAVRLVSRRDAISRRLARLECPIDWFVGAGDEVRVANVAIDLTPRRRRAADHSHPCARERDANATLSPG